MELSPFIWSQIIAGVAIIFDIISFQFKDRKHILICFTIASILLTIHFYLLDEMTTVLMSFVVISRQIIAIFSTHKAWIFFYVGLSVIFLYYSYDVPRDFIPFAGSVIGAISTFQKTDKRLREYKMASSSCWLLNDILIWTPVSILAGILFLSSNVIGYWRFYIQKIKPSSQ